MVLFYNYEEGILAVYLLYVPIFYYEYLIVRNEVLYY